MSEAQIPARIIRLYANYKNWQRYWYSVHYLAGIIAVLAGVLATASGANAGPDFVRDEAWIWGLLAALLSGVVTFLGPLQRAEAYKHAYYVLDRALTKFEAKAYSIEQLLEEYEGAQNIVLLGDPKAMRPNN